jgi:hypothetical protein
MSAAVETPNPRFRSAVYVSGIRFYNHLSGRVERANSRKMFFRFLRLIGSKANLKSPPLSMNPLVESTTHPTATIVEDFDPFDM